MNNLINRARDYAHRAHDSVNQKRKYSGEPYWVHTDEVASIIPSSCNEEVIAAAHLHDVIEDVFPIKTEFNIYDIAEQFGKRVADLVIELTDVYTKEAWPDLNRAKRKNLERQRIGNASNAAKTIKLADLISNTKSIVEHDKDFAIVYLREKLELLPYLVGGHSDLLDRCSRQLIELGPLVGLNIPTIAVK